MELVMQGTNMQLTDSLVDHAERRMKGSLKRVRHMVTGIMLRIRCVEGGGRPGSKRCLAVIQLAHGGRVVINEADADAYRAISRAASRAKRAVRRRVDRIQTLRRAACVEEAHSVPRAGYA